MSEKVLYGMKKYLSGDCCDAFNAMDSDVNPLFETKVSIYPDNSVKIETNDVVSIYLLNKKQIAELRLKLKSLLDPIDEGLSIDEESGKVV
jgi:hypothetical protein